MDSDLQFDMPLWIAGPAVLLCLLLAAYLSAAETAITGASRPRMHRLAQQGNKLRGHCQCVARPKGRGRERHPARQQRGEYLFGLAHHGRADRIVRCCRHRLRHGRDRRAGGDLRRGDAQDVGLAARRSRGAGARAVDRRDARRARPNGARRRLDLALLPQAVGRARRPHAGRRGARRRAARRHRPAWPRPGRRDGARREGDAAVGARSRRPHGGRRDDPSRQRRGDRRRPADGRHRHPDAGSALHAHPGLSHRGRQHPGRRPCQGPVPRRQGGGRARDGQDRGGPDAALVHSRNRRRASTSSRRSAPGTSISPSSSTSMARCAASSPSRTSSRRSPATSRTSTTPSSAAWSGARTAA